MPKRAYIGIDNTARRVKKLYVGVDGIARKIKKGYIGVNGVAKLWFINKPNSTSLSYKKKATALSVARHSSMPGVIRDKYALFCGGHIGTSQGNASPTVDIYNEALTRSTSALSVGKRYGVGVSTYSRMFCIGGITPSTGTATRTADSYVFDENLTMSSISVTTADHLFATQSPFGTRLGENAFVAGGQGNSGMKSSAGTISEDLTIVMFEDLSVARYEGATANIGRKYALCAGGYGTAASAVVDCYDVDGTRRTLTNLSVARNRLSAAQQDEHAMFAGGYGSSFVTAVEVYDNNLVRTLGTSLAKGRNLMASGSFDFGCIFAGGFQTTSTNGASSYCDFYNVNLVRSSISGLSSAKHGFAPGVTMKNMFLIGGGANQLSNITFQSEVPVFDYTEVY